MGWFSKKEKEVPSLPELPKLPEIEVGKLENPPVSQLPSFPTNSIGEKFSQDTIKEAVTGKKEGDEVFKANDFGESQMMPRPQEMPLIKNTEEEIPFARNIPKIKNFESQITGTEPVFIRLDKFEESLKIFEKTKEKISEIENMLRHLKELKEKEENELESWESELKSIKNQIEKVDKNIFSKIE